MTEEWIAVPTPTNVDVTLVGKATASANLMASGKWWISRVLVNEGHRGQGFGGRILEHLCNEVQGQGGTVIIVCPGGYGSNLADLVRFYKRHGFVETHDCLERTLPPEPPGIVI